MHHRIKDLRWLITAAILLAAGQAYAQAGVFRGPLLNDVTTDAVTVIWESVAPTTGTVRYGLNSVNENTLQSSTPATHHGVRITGLAQIAMPGSEFIYELEVAGNIYPGRFFTAVDQNTPFSFIVYGDNRSSDVQHQAVVDALMAEQVTINFAVDTGDLVSDGENEANWDTFFTLEAPFLANVPLYIAIGNHEVDANAWDVPERIFHFPTDVPPQSNSEAYYHFVYGNMDLIVVNVEVDSLYTGLLAGDQSDWLQNVLDNPPAGIDHRFLFIHQGPYSSKPGRSGNFWLRNWLDELKTGGVNVIISGHDHYAERGWTQNGLYYVIHGGGGAPLYTTLGPRAVSDHTIVYGESRLGYVLVNIDGPKAQVIIKGIDGAIVDAFTYGDTASPACTTASDCGTTPPQNACSGGSWACENSACTFGDCQSSGGSLITCITDNACVTQISDWCTGTATCEHPSINPLEWYCACDVPPDCTVDNDCIGRPPPIPNCQGTWACVTESCEFTPTQVCNEPPPDAGVPDDAGLPDDSGTTTDAGATTDATSSPDVTPGVDASTTDPDATSAVDASDPPATDAGVTPEPDAGASINPLPEAEEGGCGCTVHRAERDGWWIMLLGLALAATWSRSRGR